MQRLRYVGGLGSVRARQQGAECPLAFCAFFKMEKNVAPPVLEGELKHLSYFPALAQTERDRGRITGSTDLGLICRHNKFYK